MSPAVAADPPTQPELRLQAEPVIRIADLTVAYRNPAAPGGKVLAVRNLNFEVRAGEVFGFLGPNGAGKTTTLNVLLGFRSPTSGCAQVFGLDAGTLGARKRIGYLPESTYYYKFLTCEELLLFYAKLFRLPKPEARRRAEWAMELVGLSDARRRTIATYSKGMRQRAGLAQALMNDPDLLILDEPTSGLDPVARMNVRELIQRLNRAGKTILFSSHELGEVETTCDRVAILHEGQLRVEGRLDDLAAIHACNLEQLFLKAIGYKAGGGSHA